MDIEIKSFCLPETYSVSITAFFVILQAMPVVGEMQRSFELITLGLTVVPGSYCQRWYRPGPLVWHPDATFTICQFVTSCLWREKFSYVQYISVVKYCLVVIYCYSLTTGAS